MEVEGEKKGSGCAGVGGSMRSEQAVAGPVAGPVLRCRCWWSGERTKRIQPSRTRTLWARLPSEMTFLLFLVSWSAKLTFIRTAVEDLSPRHSQTSLFGTASHPDLATPRVFLSRSAWQIPSTNDANHSLAGKEQRTKSTATQTSSSNHHSRSIGYCSSNPSSNSPSCRQPSALVLLLERLERTFSASSGSESFAIASATSQNWRPFSIL